MFRRVIAAIIGGGLSSSFYIIVALPVDGRLCNRMHSLSENEKNRGGFVIQGVLRVFILHSLIGGYRHIRGTFRLPIQD